LNKQGGTVDKNFDGLIAENNRRGEQIVSLQDELTRARETIEVVAAQRNRALEAVEKLREALDGVKEALNDTELNMGNYDDDDVRHLNDGAIEAWTIADKALAATEPATVEPCTWTEEGYCLEGSGNWFASCGEAWTLFEGTPKENHYRHCPGCGKPIKQVPFAYKDEEGEEPSP